MSEEIDDVGVAERRERRFFLLIVATTVVGLAVGLVVTLPDVRSVDAVTWLLVALPTNRERTVLVRALRYGRPVPPAQHDLALRVARDVVARRHMVWLLLAVALVQGLQALVQDGWLRWMSVAVALGFVGLMFWSVWQVRRMRAADERLERT